MTATTEELRSLLAPPEPVLSETRTLTLLDTQFPTLDSLINANIDEIVLRAEESKNDLNARLKDSEQSLNMLISSTIIKTDGLLNSAQELSLTRHSLADQVSVLKEELQPQGSDRKKGTNSLLEDIEGLQERLSELKAAQSYVRVIEWATQLSQKAVEEIRSTAQQPVSESSLTSYIQLQDFAGSVVTTCEGATQEGAQLALASFVESTRDRTWNEIYEVLSSDLLSSLEKLKWPSPVDYDNANYDDRTTFEQAFVNLLHLQEAGERIHRPSPKQVESKKQGLYPIISLVQPLALRFKYHFEGKRQTNRLDKPEWYFTHILNLLHEHRTFLTNHIQPLLSNSRYKDVNAQMEFTRVLLTLPAKKLKKSVSALLLSPSLLAHTIYQALIFDTMIREEGFLLEKTWEGLEPNHLLQPATTVRQKGHPVKAKPSPVWVGLSDVILGNEEWFDAWLGGEKKFADDQYLEIISSADAWAITDDGPDDTDYGAVGADKSTTSARRVKILIQQITERYRSLPQLHQRVQFLFSAQIPVLESYMSRILASLDAYETLSSSFVRAVPGALAGQSSGQDKRRLTSGVDGLARLVKALVSAKCIKDAMEVWGEDIFFLETWHEIQEDPVQRARAEKHKSLPPTHASGAHHERTDSSLFDELIAQYESVVERAEKMITRQICGEIEGELKGYFASQWDKTGQEASDMVSLPAMLVAPISLLSAQLAFLATTLPSTVVTMLYRKTANELSTYIIQKSIVQRGRHQFTPSDGKAFADECMTWVETSRMALTVSGRCVVRKPESPWGSLIDAAAVLGMSEERFADVAQIVQRGTPDQAQSALAEIGAKSLSREDAIRLLSSRSDYAY